MARHSSATPRSETSTLSTETSDTINETSGIIDAPLKRRARLLITNGSIPRQTRNLIRCALQTKDPRLAQIVRRVDAGEETIDHLYNEPL